ncbi:hypothetical protein B296_00057010, partial [Ensete ventricosum]
MKKNCNCNNQGLQFRPVPPGTGDTYWSARLPIRGPPATGRFRQKSTIGGRLREKSTVDGRLRKKKGKRRGEERIPRPPDIAARNCLRTVTAHGRFFSRTRRRSVSSRGETDRGR